MDLQILRSKDFKTSEWQGGTTTELYLYPENGNYEKRDFEVRVSSAVVSLEASDFTKLEGVERWLMVLEGKFMLKHENQEEIYMQPYDISRFMGDLNTSSKGKVRDFNLMLKNGKKGELFYRQLSENQHLELRGISAKKYIIYVIEGQGSLLEKNLNKGELGVLKLEKFEKVMLINTGSDPLKLAICEIEGSYK